ncbi:MAG TPA: FAD-binding oxidoreductase [Ktedonobacteraceae bacterium]|nr:FAD-binding oxidoreductase [Ktedonobacteraceae bacterium]
MQADHTFQSANQVHDSSSYWQETVSHPVLSDDLPPVVEVAVIGGGILGASIGYWLARMGVISVVLERTRMAHEATGRNGGIVSIGPAEMYPAAITRLGYETAHAILTLTRENQALLLQVLEEERITCDYRETGSLSLALDAQQLTALTQEAMALQTDGIVATPLDRAQVQERIGTPLGPDIVGGRFKPATGVIHPIRLVQGLVKAAQRSGAKVCTATALRLMPRNGRVVVQTTRGALQAETVIIATNAWIGELLPQFAHLITPVRGQVLAYAPTGPIFSTAMSAAITPTGEYWQQRSDGTIVLGGCRAVAPGGDIGIRLNQPTVEVQMALEQVLPRLFPALGGLEVVHRWAGMMAFTPDYLPIVDRVPDMPGALVVGGFCGHGMPFALRFGQLLADALTRSTWPSALLPFRLKRETLVKR